MSGLGDWGSDWIAGLWVGGLVRWWVGGLVRWWVGALVGWWVGGLVWVGWWIGGWVGRSVGRSVGRWFWLSWLGLVWVLVICLFNTVVFVGLAFLVVGWIVGWPVGWLVG